MGSIEDQLADYRAKKAKDRSQVQVSNNSVAGRFSLFRRKAENNPPSPAAPAADASDVESSSDTSEKKTEFRHTGGEDSTRNILSERGDAEAEETPIFYGRGHSMKTEKGSCPAWLVSIFRQFPLLQKIVSYEYTGLILKVTLWLVLWLLFIELEFGAVYFVVSLLYVIYASLRTGPRNGPSAYSVFNPDLQRLEGTFTAEEFDNQMRRGGGLM